MPSIILRPLTTGELLDRTFSLYRKHFSMFVGIAAIPYLGVLALNLAAFVHVGGAYPLPRVQYSLLALVASLLAMAAVQAATLVAVSDVYLEQAASVRASYERVIKRIPALLGISIAVWVMVGFGFVLLIIPGMIWWMMWSLTIPVAVLENKGLSAATKRSRELTKGSRGRISVIYFLFGVLSYMVTMMLQLPMIVAGVTSAMHHLGAPTWVLIWGQFGTFISHILTGPLLTIALSLVYYDQRVRKEAFDLQVMMAALDGTPAESASTENSFR